MSNQQRPPFGTRVRAFVQGEKPTANLQRYMNVSGVLDLLEDTQQERARLISEGVNPWELNPSQQCRLQEAFVAVTFYWTLCDLVKADELYDPRTVEFAPPETIEQAMRFAVEFGGHMAASREAAADPDYRPAHPGLVKLPAWVEVEPCPAAHLHAMVQLAKKMAERIEALLNDIEGATLNDRQQREFQHVKGVLERGFTKARMAEDLYGTGGEVSQVQHEEIEKIIKEAIQALFEGGQILCAPMLGTNYNRNRPAIAAASALPQPGEPGFDPLCITWSTLARAMRRGNARHYDVDARRGIESINATWRRDPNPELTLAIQAEINEAMHGPSPAVVPSHEGFWSCCPWSPIRRVVRPVTISGVHLLPGDTFIFDVSAEEMDKGGPFVRRIVRGPFSPAPETDYCDGADDD